MSAVLRDSLRNRRWSGTLPEPSRLLRYVEDEDVTIYEAAWHFRIPYLAAVQLVQSERHRRAHEGT